MYIREYTIVIIKYGKLIKYIHYSDCTPPVKRVIADALWASIFVGTNGKKTMMSKEEVAEIITYCKEKGLPYKSRLDELGIPEWKFYESKARYAKQQAENLSSKGEFLQLTSGGAFVPMPSFAATTGRGFSKKEQSQQKMYEAAVERLKLLYDLLRKQILQSEYVQVNESVIPVIDNEKHKARKGYE